MLDKSKTLFDRDEKGELIPKTVKLEGTKDEIRIIPITRGKWLKLLEESKITETTKDQDRDLVLTHCIEPKYTEEDFTKESIKPAYVTAIVKTIIKNSGISIDEGDNQKK